MVAMKKDTYGSFGISLGKAFRTKLLEYHNALNSHYIKATGKTLKLSPLCEAMLKIGFEVMHESEIEFIAVVMSKPEKIMENDNILKEITKRRKTTTTIGDISDSEFEKQILSKGGE